MIARREDDPSEPTAQGVLAVRPDEIASYRTYVAVVNHSVIDVTAAAPLDLSTMNPVGLTIVAVGDVRIVTGSGRPIDAAVVDVV